MIDKLKFLSIFDRIKLIDKNRSLLIFLTALVRRTSSDWLHLAASIRSLPTFLLSIVLHPLPRLVVPIIRIFMIENRPLKNQIDRKIGQEKMDVLLYR